MQWSVLGPGGKHGDPFSAAGLLDSSANALFVFATRGGYRSVVSVLGSLYPVVTLLAAHVVLHERITRVRRGGGALALVGVSGFAAVS